PSEKGNALEKIAVKEVEEALKENQIKDAWLALLKDLNVCSQKGLVEMFDASIGAGTVVMPYGGKYQLSEIQTMVAKLPVLKGKTDTVTMMSYGFEPYVSSWSPYHGAIYAITESMAKIVAAGGDYSKIRFTFQEYFRRMTEDKSRWSQPFAALLGAFDAQIGFGLPSIGGKDSMSGTFQNIDVPPTLVSFAVDVAKQQDVVTPELKAAGNQLVMFELETDDFHVPVYAKVMEMYDEIHRLMQEGIICSAYAMDTKGAAAAISKMAFGNRLGVEIDDEVEIRDLFKNGLGGIVAEVDADRIQHIDVEYTVLGTVIKAEEFRVKDQVITMEEALNSWKGTLEHVFPTKGDKTTEAVNTPIYNAGDIYVCKNKIAKPNVFIPVFPGTNCEYDSTKAFERAGASVVTRVFKNLTASDIRESVEIFEQEIENAQIIMFPGGFSAGDEPDGSAKFFATAFQNAKIKEAVTKLLEERDGLCLGICNGFQALIKLGLVPYGKIVGQKEDSPTLTYNTINRHISKMVYTKVVSNKSPWLALAETGKTYVNPASHGEGRFVANEEWLNRLFENGQVATQYCDPEGRISMDEEWNVNGSYLAIEGITSPDGRCLGKMAHSERRDHGVAVNIYGEQDLKIFEAGVKYFR
ncbi:MAG: phosphoribosylformylglycinamidine synthase subunit PurQ, partial [Lachnospiraceae bacterium]|nr:phosphoribosylformylglycinamidine synthase subunit PurQ [Lachnospiraceae bacterium]